MTRPTVHAATPYRLGDRVEDDGGAVAGTVVTVQDCGPDRQVLGVQQPGGPLVSVAVRVTGGAVIAPPVDIATGTGLARLIASGTDPRLPVGGQLQTLAATVLTLAARLAGREVAS